MSMTRAENELLTRTGRGTPMGELLRRYWHPVCTVADLRTRWTKRVRIMGEDLVAFRDRSGTIGVIAEACPHRRASLAYGIPEADGIRCPYHGWKFDGRGRCLEQPNEPEGSSFKEKVGTSAYPVTEMGGLIWAYLGPLPAPLPVRLEGYVAAPAIRMIGRSIIPCNWLQIMENSADPIHSEWLHGHFLEFMAGAGKKVPFSSHHLKIAFDEVPYGIIKRRLKVGQSEDCSDWRIGHPLVFPNTLALGSSDATWRQYEFQVRVPADDEHTLHFWYTSFVPPAGASVARDLLENVCTYEIPDGSDGYDFSIADHQDIMAWTTQGPVTDREREHLGSTDRGITLYRRMLLRELTKVQNGEDPMLVGRDPNQDAILDLPLEYDKGHYADGFENRARRRNWKFSPILEEIIALFHATRAPAHV